MEDSAGRGEVLEAEVGVGGGGERGESRRREVEPAMGLEGSWAAFGGECGGDLAEGAEFEAEEEEDGFWMWREVT